MTTWRVRLPCTRAEAAAVPLADAFAADDEPPTLLTDEPDPTAPDAWTLDAYFAREPDAGDLAVLFALAPSAPPGSAGVERLDDTDWVTLSQSGFAPVRAGRFVVHTAAHADAVRASDIGLRIEAGLAFGTGQHATTRGCLIALDRLARRRRFARIVDVGTGTGVLALAAVRRWSRARVLATDIDPVAISVACGNFRANAAVRGRIRGRIAPRVTAGARKIRAGGPFDLVIANILAGPLITMAGDITAVVAPRGVVVLAGLLDTQARRVAAAYTMRGLQLIDLVEGGDWPTLVLRRR